MRNAWPESITHFISFRLVLAALCFFLLLNCAFHQPNCQKTDIQSLRLNGAELLLGNINLREKSFFEYNFISCQNGIFYIVLEPSCLVQANRRLLIELFSQQDGCLVITNFQYVFDISNKDNNNPSDDTPLYILPLGLLMQNEKRTVVMTLEHLENGIIVKSKDQSLSWGPCKNSPEFKAKAGHSYTLRVYTTNLKTADEPAIFSCRIIKKAS